MSRRIAEPSPIVQTIAQQVQAGCEPSARAAIKRYVQLDETTLRVHVKIGRRVLNTDIRYDRGPDTYTVTRHRGWDGISFTTSTSVSDIYCDQLAELCFDPE
jgi:hypothetical protein